ncbi:MAG TPA: heparan-alpha-glucosaminide N-acetyltransferase domain-containing protein [Steroidobacteraceae bacterium]|nr:heparan-alpha-glucosaminide N-acetyltransferase domain-containing protein [Steroidobacteraceae bacterium]
MSTTLTDVSAATRASPVVTATRWDALDVLRGLTIMLMLLNLAPGSWEHNYGFLEHAKWEGGALIDMVAPAFLFCIGVAMPLSFARRAARGASRGDLLRHVLWRGLLLVAIGYFLNVYPRFEFATARIPGVLQRIGLCYALAGAFMIATARADSTQRLALRVKPLIMAAVVILLSYWALLYFVPVPGFGAPRFDPVGSWPSVVDRAVIGPEHFFQYWPVDGKVVFDPEGLLSTWPACVNILFGALVGMSFMRGRFARPAMSAMSIGATLMLLALVTQSVDPIIKNLWTSSFVLFSCGFALAVLGLLMPLTQRPGVSALFAPARVFGENPLLAYILCFLMAPLIDANWFGAAGAPRSLRAAGQAFFEQFAEPRAASLLFGLCGILLLYAVLLFCHRRRWILKL